MSYPTQSIVDDDFVSIALSSSSSRASSNSSKLVHISTSEAEDYEFFEITDDHVPLALTQDQRRTLKVRYPNDAERSAYVSLYNHKIRLCCSTKPLDQWIFKAVERVLNSLDAKTEEARLLEGERDQMRRERDDAIELLTGLHGEMGDLQQFLTDTCEELDEKEGEVEVVQREVEQMTSELRKRHMDVGDAREELRKKNLEVDGLRRKLKEVRSDLQRKEEDIEDVGGDAGEKQ